MSTVVILGLGEVGAAACRYAAKLDTVTALRLGDRDPTRVRSEVGRVGARATGHAVDVTNAASLDAVLSGADVLLNCVGPYYRFAEPVFEAALRHGVTYLDVNDDWEPTLILLNRNADAERAGVAAMVGMGASPGVSNLLAARAMQAVPDATSLVTAWREDDPTEGYSAAKEHWLQQCSGTIRTVEAGVLADMPPLQPVTVDFPDRGTVELTTVGHPEPVTLIRRFPGLQTSVNAMACPPAVRATLSRIQAAIDGGQETPRSAAERFESFKRSGEDTTSLGLPGIFAVARAPSGAQAVTVLRDYPKGLGPVTAAPLVTALACYLDGEAVPAGVHAPEDVFDPERFLTRFSAIAGLEDPCWSLHVG